MTDSTKGFPVKERTIKVRRKSGVIYVYKRHLRYNPKKGFEESLDSELIGKILPGSNDIVPTRPKRDSKRKASDQATAADVSAQRQRTGMTDMLEFIGKQSGLDRAVSNALADSDARKLLSIARFWTSTHDTLPHFEKWQIMHPTPYPDGISEDVYYKFFRDLGSDEGARQRLFLELSRGLGKRPILAFDTTTVSTYSENQTSARFGFNKDHDGLPTIKLVSLFSQEHMRPVGFAFQPGNIPDCISVENAIKQLDALGLAQPLLVFDAGFGIRANVTYLLRKHQKFLGLGDISAKWISSLLDLTDANKSGQEFAGIKFGAVCARERLKRIDAMCPYDEHTQAVTVAGMMPFSWERQRARGDRAAHDEEGNSFRLYVHFYVNTQRREADIASLRKRLNDLRELLLAGTVELNQQAQQLVEDFMTVKTVKDRKRNVSFNEDAFQERTKNYGIFALISNEVSDPFEALRTYRLREYVEADFRDEKLYLDGAKPRTWSLESLTGREICRQISLGYEFALLERLRKVKARIQAMIQEKGRTKTDVASLVKLRTWLNNRSALGVLEWFDCIETMNVQSPSAQRRWSTEKTKQDKRFLELFFDPNL